MGIVEAFMFYMHSKLSGRCMITRDVSINSGIWYGRLESVLGDDYIWGKIN